MEPPNQAADQLLSRVRDSGLGQIRVVFVDYNGLTRARSVSTGNLSSVLRRGVNFSSPTVDFNSRDLFPPAAAFDLASSDFWALPDVATFRSLPARTGAGLLLADLVDADGAPWPGCIRTSLKHVVERAAQQEISFNVGLEPEGYVFHTDTTDGFVVSPGFATLDGLDIVPAFMTELLTDLEAAGICPEQWSEEYGPGQIEINLPYGPALDACDDLVVFKYLFRAAARHHGLTGTFMPKPYGEHAGSGLHVHLSASPLGEPSVNLFDDPNEGGAALSRLGLHALAGLLDHGEALTATGATTVNSYKRFAAGSWAPTQIMWAQASRAAFVRVPERQTARRLELRVGDGAGNPYLFVTAVLAAMLDGIAREAMPEPAVEGDVALMSSSELARLGARPLPRTLGEALTHFAGDEVIREAVQPLIADEFVKIKRSEWDSFCMHVGAWDRDWYLSRF